MTKTNPSSERIKRDCFRYLAEARGRDEATIDGVAKSLVRFEEATRNRDFRRFRREQAVAFKSPRQSRVIGLRRIGERASAVRTRWMAARRSQRIVRRRRRASRAGVRSTTRRWRPSRSERSTPRRAMWGVAWRGDA